MHLKTFVRLFVQTYTEWTDDKVPRLGAALAYYTMFSVAPLLVIAIAIAGFVYGEDAARGEVARQIQDAIGAPAAAAVQDMIRHTSHNGHGVLATILGTVTLLVGAAGGFWQLQDALNTVWKVAPKPGRGIWGVVRDRLVSFLVVLGTGLFLVASLAVTTALVAVSRFVPLPELPGGLSVLQLINGLVSILSVGLLSALLYKFLPDAKIAWRDVWLGALVTAVLFTVGKQLLGLYLGYASVASAFGAAGSLVLVLFWVYYSSQIFLFGAEFTRVHAVRNGSPIEPTENAVLVTPEELARQGMPRTEDLGRAAGEGPGNR